MTVTFDMVEPLLWGVSPLVLGGLLWQALRYRCPPELVAMIATMGPPLAGLWRPDLLGFALTPDTWLWLGGLLALSIVALRTTPMRDTRDVFLLGMLAGGLPTAFVAARAAKDARSAGRLAIVAAGAAAISPLGGPVQFMLAGPSLDWWLASAPAGAVAVAICWRGNELADPVEPAPVHPRVRWLVAVAWMGIILQLVGIPWATQALIANPPKTVEWVWFALAWAGGNLVDPWIVADYGTRTIALGAAHDHLHAAIVGLTIPNLAIPVMAWTLSDWRAAIAALPAIVASVAVASLALYLT